MQPSTQIGYCTNVHAGPTLAQTQANLRRYALEVKRQVSPSNPMGIGLWLAAPAVEELLANEQQLTDFSGWLQTAGLVPFTFNGFPYGDFHGEVVKHRVYEPTWWNERRFNYTRQLIQAQHRLLPVGMSGTISTLPIAWSEPSPTNEQLFVAAGYLSGIAQELQRLHQETGRMISICLEPEPGCYLQRGDDILRFFQDWLLLPQGGTAPAEAAIRQHIRVCHDICHSAVMFEPQAEVLRKYAAAGIQVGKVQVSAAVSVRFDELSPSDRLAAFEQLAGFSEPRYLHQTCVRIEQDAPRFYVDLGLALASQHNQAVPSGEWRTHFHVPIYLEKFDRLLATQDDIRTCLATLRETSSCEHFEVETYAWSVLPRELQVAELADGIAREMRWFYENS